MKMSIKVFMAASLAAMLFSFFSGCKAKQKLVTTSSIIDHSQKSSSDSTRVLLTKAAENVKLDSGVLILSSRTLNKKEHSLELHFQLDSNKTIRPLDSTGKFDLRDLINRGLESATSLIIKVTDQQSQANESSSTNKQTHKLTQKLAETKDSTGVKKAAEKKDLKTNSRLVAKSKDSTVAKNAGGGGIVLFAILGVAAIACFFIFKK